MQELYFCHGMNLEQVKYGPIISGPEYANSDYQLSAYLWLQKELGFYPIFLGVGDERAVYQTGYHFNWQRKFLSGYDASGKPLYQKISKERRPHRVVFFFPLETHQVVFTAYPEAWHNVIRHVAQHSDLPLQPDMLHQLFCPQFNYEQWLDLAMGSPMKLQAVTGKLDLTTAVMIWVSNKKARQQLEALGFKNVIVKRIKVPRT